jgi:hypothetical protein
VAERALPDLQLGDEGSARWQRRRVEVGPRVCATCWKRWCDGLAGWIRWDGQDDFGRR